MDGLEDEPSTMREGEAATESCIMICFVQFGPRLTSKLATLSMGGFPQNGILVGEANEIPNATPDSQSIFYFPPVPSLYFYTRRVDEIS